MIINTLHPSQQLQHYFYRKPQPNFSIKIQQVQEQTKHTFTCECQMCRQYHGKKVVELLNVKTQVINKKIKQKIQDGKISSDYFLQILKKLVIPHHKVVKRGIDIYIPQICFFKDGQSKGLFMNKELDDFTIKKIHKNSVNPGLIAKLFNQRRRQYKQNLKKLQGISNRRSLSQPQKYSLLQKSNKKQVPAVAQSQIVIKHTDGLQSMMTETEFIMLTLRRKQDPIWKTIQIIKNLINVNDEINNIFFVKYQKANIRFQNLLLRTKTLAKIYGQNIIPGQSMHISDEQEQRFSLQLIKNNKAYFAQYVVYKIVSFIEFFFDQQIIKLSCKILINQVNKPFLIDVTSYKKKNLIRFTWTHDTYRKKMEEQQRKLFINRAVDLNSQMDQKASMIKELMEHKYNEMKAKYGISLQQSDNEEQIKNNQFFKRTHPEFEKKSNGAELSEVLMNDKHLTVNGFKAKYLGWKEEKKPIFKDFTTHMIKVLHKTTPKLKISSFHQIPFKPNQSGFFSSRRPATSQITKRLSFSAITSPTKNKSRPDSVQSPRKSSSRNNKSRGSTSRTPTSATYRKSTGCHLHMSNGNQEFVTNFLNFHK